MREIKPRPSHRLIVTADDFGRSQAINQAVVRAHREGILTSASLMVGEPAAEEALALARQHPRLGVGLHLTLVRGKPVLPPAMIPELVGADGCFPAAPALTGWRYFSRPGLRAALTKEIEAQISRFRAMGLELDHLNGHLHFHLHPLILQILINHAPVWGLRHVRLTRDPLLLNLRLARGRYGYRLGHAVLFGLLARWGRPALARRGIRHPERVFGLLQDGSVDEAFLVRLIPNLPPGDSELYSHPSLDGSRAEFEALISPRVRDLLDRRGVTLIRYRDL
jgi:hopanoid biosynthesis associated protein HpnK